jgi:hypothetical protein
MLFAVARLTDQSRGAGRNRHSARPGSDRTTARFRNESQRDREYGGCGGQQKQTARDPNIEPKHLRRNDVGHSSGCIAHDQARDGIIVGQELKRGRDAIFELKFVVQRGRGRALAWCPPCCGTRRAREAQHQRAAKPRHRVRTIGAQDEYDAGGRNRRHGHGHRRMANEQQPPQPAAAPHHLSQEDFLRLQRHAGIASSDR